VESHSGRLLLRMPRSLHADLAALAEREGVSLNTLITRALEGFVKPRGRWRSGHPSPGRQGESSGRPQSRFVAAALVINFVVVALVAAVAIGLLVTAWRHGW
jgi:RNA polymerase sigma-B factor